jgi:hypothetical protein
LTLNKLGQGEDENDKKDTAWSLFLSSYGIDFPLILNE